MFNRSERETLNNLSKELYNSASKWQKEFERGAFNIPTETVEVKDQVETVQFKGKNGKHGPIMSRVKALARKLVTEEQVPLERTRQVQKYRPPTFVEMIQAFEQMIDSQKISRLPKDQMIQVLAYRYVHGGLLFNLSLVPKENGAEAVEAALMNVSNEETRAELRKLLVTEEKQATGLPLDAVQFIQDVILATSHGLMAKELLYDSLRAVNLHPKPTIPHAMLSTLSFQDGQTKKQARVSTAEKARRRAKNKAARKARKVTRSA